MRAGGLSVDAEEVVIEGHGGCGDDSLGMGESADGLEVLRGR